jgi:hypothetical protein
MALVDNIPLPKSGMQAFDDSLLNSQQIFNSLVNNRRINTLLPGEVTAQQDAHLLAPYTRDLTHSQAQSNYAQALRSNKLLPLDMQKEADEHDFQKYRIQTAIADNNLKNSQSNRSNQLLPGDVALQPVQRGFVQSEADKNNELIRQSLIKRKIDLRQRGLDENGNPIPAADANMPATVGSQFPQSASSNNTSMFDNLISPQANNAADALSETSPAMTPIRSVTGFQNTPIAGTPNFQNTSITQPSSATLYPALAQKMQNMQSTPPQQPPQTPLTAQGQQQVESNKENANSIIELQAPRKGDEWKDQAINSTNMGDKIPGVVKLGENNGYIIQQYPSGAIKAVKEVSSPADIEQEKINVKNADKLDQAAQAHAPMIDILSNMTRLLQEHPEISNYPSGYLAEHNFNSSTPAGEYQALSKQAQAQLARQGSNHGGAYALMFGAQGKADIKNPATYNLGMLKGLLDEEVTGVETSRKLKNKYMPGKELMFDYPESYQKLKASEERNGKNPDKLLKLVTPEQREYTKKKYNIRSDRELDTYLKTHYGYK